MVNRLWLLPLFCLPWVTPAKVAQAQVFQALAQREGVYNLNDYNGSRLLDRAGTALSTVSITSGRLDLTRGPGETRAALLARLHRAGMRVLFVSSQDSLFVQPFGALAPLPPQGAVVQVLTETAAGYSLTDWSGSSIVDTAGALLGRVAVAGGQPSLVPGPQVTLGRLYDSGLRLVALAPRRLARVERDPAGAVHLRLAP